MAAVAAGCNVDIGSAVTNLLLSWVGHDLGWLGLHFFTLLFLCNSCW
jgi:hypothetical protein